MTVLTFQTTDIKAIAKHLAKLDKVNSQRPRTVVITQGADETIVVRSEGSSAEPSIDVKKVEKMAADQIVDTNGAGDAFAGGFLGGVALGKSIDDAIELGHWLASLSIKLMG